MVGFAEMASVERQADWLKSSVFSILVDLVAFELAPALVVSGVGVVTFGCRCKCGLHLIWVVEGYRAIRSLVGV